MRSKGFKIFIFFFFLNYITALSQNIIKGKIISSDKDFQNDIVEIYDNKNGFVKTVKMGEVFEIIIDYKSDITLAFVAENYPIIEKKIETIEEKLLIISLPARLEKLSEVVIGAKKKRLFQLRRLKDYEGTSVFAGKKTEVIIKSIHAAKKRQTIIIREKDKNQIQNSIILINDKISNELLTKKDIGKLQDGLDLEQTDFQPGQKRESNIYRLYEDNIGQMTPVLAEELKLAEKNYPNLWIEEAIIEAVKNNIRNWKYISSILNRWQIEGRTNGESTRYSKKSERESQLRRAQKFRDEFINKKS